MKKVDVPKVRAETVTMHRVTLDFGSSERWFDGETLQEAANQMASFLNAAGWRRHWIDQLTSQAGADPEELEW